MGKKIATPSPDQLVDIGQQFYERRWMWGTAGNLSLRLESDPLRFAITPSSVNKGHLKAEELLTIQNGTVSPKNSKGLVPSSETVIHEAVYKAVPGAGAVFHVHPMFSTLISKLHGHPREVKMLDIEWFEMMKGVGVGEEEMSQVAILPNWQDVSRIASDLTRYVQTSKKVIPVVLIYNHGLTGWGTTPDKARNHLEIMEYVCQYLYLKRIGDRH